MTLKQVLSDHLYCPNQGFRTAELSLPFKAFETLAALGPGLVELDGIEPSTSCMPCKRSPS
jgi:site-specific DNA recombinase